MKKYIGLSIVALSMAFASCDSYLDKLPDNRMELQNQDHISSLLVSAYAEHHPAYLLEMYSDNTDECRNTGWTEADNFQRQAYQWADITETLQDEAPQELWQGYYKAVSTANACIQFIKEQEDPSEYSAQMGEALVCRAYSMFMLSTVFCNAYSPATASKELGLPYPTEVETIVGQTYERGTLADLYAKIEADLKEGMSTLTSNYDKPKFHFTPDAANAFAARFYLYYGKYDEAISCANKVLGENPAAKLRDWDYYDGLNANKMIQPEAYVAADERSNLLLISVLSEWGAIHGPYIYGDRYAHGSRIANDETMRSVGPWGESSDFKYTVWYNDALAKYIFRKVPYEFEYTDLQAGIGFAHAEYAVFTTDQLLLERAEAYALKGELEAAMNDVNTELAAFHSSPTNLTVDDVKDFYNSINYYVPQEYTVQEDDGAGNMIDVTYSSTPKKKLNPVFGTIDADGSDQESMLQCILHLRRILTLHEGIRMQDVKRYGITIYRRTMNSDYQIIKVTDTMNASDARRAIQIPHDVISAGLEGNVRINKAGDSQNRTENATNVK